MREERDESGREQIPNDFVECLKCGAMLPARRTQLHLEWHEALRKAVDETGVIGDFRGF